MNKIKNITAEKIASIGVFALLAIYPISLTDKYCNITVTRYLFFTIAAAFFFAVCLIIKIQTINKPKKISPPKITDFSSADIFFL